MHDDPITYAELHCLSNFTFLRGASHPEELVLQAHALGYTALALTDECSLSGAVRAHLAAKECGLHLILGSELILDDGLRLVLLATDRDGYGELAALITQGRRAAAKGDYLLTRADLAAGVPGCLALWLPGAEVDRAQAQWIAQTFPARAWIAVELLCGADDRAQLNTLSTVGAELDLPLVASGDVHMHVRVRRALQDTLTAIRLRVPLAQAGQALYANGERHLRPRARLAEIYPTALLAQTQRIASACRFSLDELRYEYPREWLPPQLTPAQYLRELTEAGAQRRWPTGVPDKVRTQIEHELALIADLNYEAYFLTVHDIVQFARSRNILCQGRGSAANSAVCFCLGITEVDPARMEMLFERFISKERDEPPDIDVDFEHERREEVIQHVYAKYGRSRAALAASITTYRTRSALRDVGKALGMDLAQVERLVKALAWWDTPETLPQRLREAGFDPQQAMIQRLLALVDVLRGFPRHLSQHVGGMVVSHADLSRMVPIENAAMPERTVIQWDKNDLDAMGLMKVDCLALGMLSAIHKAFDLLERHKETRWTLATLPAEDAAVYKMIQHADTIGVFQIESRAQMAMLPRLKPKNFYDLVIQIAIVRPGPIQGDMVHPYLRRRQGRERVDYPSPEVKEVLQRTLGVPIFQEQVIKLATVAAGFTPGEADQLRRSMASWTRNGNLDQFQQRLIAGMRSRGYSEHYAQQIFQQIQGFGEYGFPESHSASFALLAYASAWLKCHEPAAFTCALLNSQPMGFYAPAQLVQDAQRHGVTVRAVDARVSDWDCTLERDDAGVLALRLGLRMAKGLSQAGAQHLCAARDARTFTDVPDLAQRAALSKKDLRALAAAGALAGLAGNRHQAHWQVQGVERPLHLLEAARSAEALPLLRPPTLGERIGADYVSLGLSLHGHPVALLRSQLQAQGALTAAQLRQRTHGATVRTAGLVITRQRPGSASGVIFLTLEDETGITNVVVWPNLAEREPAAVRHAPLVGVTGKLQRQGEVLHLVATQLHDLSRDPRWPLDDHGTDGVLVRRNFK